jgi:DNA-directed RNA polymerase II subunit RPB2
MPQLIQSSNPILILKDPLAPEQGIYKYKTEIYIGGKVENAADLRLEIGAPIITLDNGQTVRRMFPNEARLRGLTYAAQIRADIDIVITMTQKRGEDYESVQHTIPFKNFPLLKLPILLRSKLCSLGAEATDASMIQKGESPLEHGGYFIIDGAEKILITRQEQAFNSMYVARKALNDLDTAVYASVVSQNPITKMNRRCSVYLGRDDNVMRVSIPSVRGDVPLFVLFRALGIESDSDIVRLIFPDPESPFTKLYEDILIPSIQDAWPITTQAMAIHFIATVTHQGSVASVLDILRNHLFSHVPNKPMARAYYLAEMVQQVIKSNAKLIANTDRDDIRTQRLLTTGTLLRDLFAAIWKDWKKALVLAVDKQYNYNKTLYEGEKFFDLFSSGNAHTTFQTEMLNTTLMRGFRGRWGTTSQNTKTGVLQPLARISYNDAMSHCRRILLDFDTSLKQKGPRHLHTSQVGYFCTNETPTGAHIGVSKNYSMLTYVSLAAPVEPLINWLETRGTMVPIALADRIMRASGTLVKINGGTVGFVKEPVQLVAVLKLMKWTACLGPLTSIAFNTTDREIRIYLDEGRPVRPLWHLSANAQWPPMAQFMMENPQVKPVWRDLVCGNLPLTANRGINAIDFIDPLQTNPQPTLQNYIDLLTPHIGAIEYADPYEMNENFVSWWGGADLGVQHTHVEIHPSTMLGLMVSMIPFANHNQSPRNQLSCSQSKQGIGYYATNYLQRYDTYGSQLCYGEAPLVRTLVYDHAGRGQVPYGFNCTVAMMSTDGYNQDDGILFNRSSVERGLFRSLSLRSYETREEIDTLSKVVYKIANPKIIPAWTDIRPGCDYSKLDENGIIREGEFIDDTTVLVGRYLENPETHQIKDSSLKPTVFTHGRVDSVVVLNQANGFRLVRIRILQERIPELGDKFGSRHGQKGTMGMLIPEEDMPHTANGIIPDVLVNPHGLTSRMTVAQLLECLFGRMGAEVAAKCNSTTFFNRENIVKIVGESLMAQGLHPHTENIMYCGLTGKQLSTSIFMGPLYFMRMKHLTADKMNSRGAGRREVRTHQPTGGRGNEGGMRIGEMERDAVLAHGTTLFLQESLMKRADATNFWVCNGCGTIPIYNEKEGLFVCPMCDGPLEFSGSTEETLTLIKPLRRSRVTFSKVEMPYALKLLDQEVTTFTCTGLRYVTERSVGRLRDNMLKIKQGGGGQPPAPESYIKAVDATFGIPKAPLIPDSGPEGAQSEVIHAGATEDIPSFFKGGAAPLNTIDTVPLTQQQYLAQRGGTAPIDAIGSDNEPLTQQQYLAQRGGTAPIDYVDPTPTLKTSNTIYTGGAAPVDSIGKDPIPVRHTLEEEWPSPQNGGSAPVDSIGKDPIPVRHTLEEEWPSPQNGGAISIGRDLEPVKYTPEDDDKSQGGPQIGVQTGGGVDAFEIVRAETPAPIDAIGTVDFNQATFSQPSMGSEPFVIANPYTSPPLTMDEVKMPAAPTYIQPVSATVQQSVAPSLLQEVKAVVQQGGKAKEPKADSNVTTVFENADIRVIKLE